MRGRYGPCSVTIRSTCRAAARNPWRGGVVLNAQIEAGAIGRLRRPGIQIEVLYDVQTRSRRLAKEIGKGNRFLGKDRYPKGLGRLVKGNRDDVP
jgi:hypothetical protein